MAITGSIGSQKVVHDGNDLWEEFTTRPRVGLAGSVIIGTWRGDVRSWEPSGGAMHCGMRTYGLPGDAAERFLDSVEAGTAAGWERAEPVDPLPLLSGTNAQFCNISERLVGAMRPRIRAAWNDPGNPRFSAFPGTEGLVIVGIYDRRTSQAYTWFSDGG